MAACADGTAPKLKAASRRGIDSRPSVTLYVHLSQDAITGHVGAGRVEGVGPVTLARVKAWLSHCHVTVRPVLDLAHQTPVDVFPYATSTSRGKDADHTIPYVSPDDGGPPGQTATANLGPMTRFHRRIKTHGR